MNKNGVEKVLIKPISLSFFFKIIDYEDKSFDYKKEINLITRSTKKSIFCCQKKSNKDIIFRNNQIDIDQEYETTLFRARKSKNNYFELIYPLIKMNFRDDKEIEKLDNRLWYMFGTQNQDKKYKGNEEYNLLKNDIIKFGMAKYEIIEKNISSSSSISEIKSQLNKINNKSGSIFKYENNETNICEICNDTNSNEENPKVKLCKCENYIHYKCLKKSLKQKIKKEKKEKVISYKCEKFYCEICKSQYPYKFNINNKDYPLIDLNIPEQNDYIILESLNQIIEGKKDIKKIFVVKLTDKEITIGKRDGNDIVIDEGQNISRNHCLLKYDKEKDLLTIIDNSKYGTSVLIKDNIKIELNKKLYFQTGNVYTKAECKEEEELKDRNNTTINMDI